jgi:PKD repeat protein
LAYYDYFYKIAATYPGMITFGDGSKGFNDVLASWTQNRVVDQQCGQTWLNTLADSGKFYSSTKQLPYLQIATWNDYEEGTSIESGIDNCLSVSASMSGSTVQWQLAGAGLENTIDHYSVFISLDGQNLMPLSDVATGTYALDLSQYGLGPAAYTVYVKAVGKASLKNQMSNAVSYLIPNQPPKASLRVIPISGIAPVTVTASTSGSFDSDGTISSSQINFGDGTIVTGATASHTYNSAGLYTITATVTDDLGASSSATSNVTVTAPSVTISQPVPGSSLKSPVQVVASAVSGLPITGMWVYVDSVGVYSVYASSLNTSLKIAPGKHVIQVKAWDSAGNITSSSVTITVLSGTELVRPTRTARDGGTATTTTSSQSQTATTEVGVTRAKRLKP